jgi:hypothetical protein
MDLRLVLDPPGVAIYGFCSLFSVKSRPVKSSFDSILIKVFLSKRPF